MEKDDDIIKSVIATGRIGSALTALLIKVKNTASTMTVLGA